MPAFGSYPKCGHYQLSEFSNLLSEFTNYACISDVWWINEMLMLILIQKMHICWLKKCMDVWWINEMLKCYEELKQYNTKKKLHNCWLKTRAL